MTEMHPDGSLELKLNYISISISYMSKNLYNFSTISVTLFALELLPSGQSDTGVSASDRG